jgi:NAD(P)-dependent dehydrogenase (short-subunit alcohol dehydrogenase family)
MADDKQDSAGQVVMVNGGTRGIGLAIAEGFLASGATVVTTSRKEFEVPTEWSPDWLGRHAHHQCDQRNDEAVNGVVAAVAERFGRLDVLINNAGGSPQVDFSTVSSRFIEAVVAMNLTGPLLSARAANKVMQTQAGGGLIVFISSMAAVDPAPGWIAYGAAKAGLDQATKSLAVEWGPRVRLLSLALGAVMTERVRDAYDDPAPDNTIRATMDSSALARPVDASEVANLCVFLASDQCAYLSGITVPVHGGGSASRLFNP